MKSILAFFRSMLASISQNNMDGVKLQEGEKIELKIPEAILKNGVWRISEWYVETGDIVSPGKVLCKIESKKKPLISNLSYMEK